MNARQTRILVVDDEQPIRKLLRAGLCHARLCHYRRAERPNRACGDDQ